MFAIVMFTLLVAAILCWGFFLSKGEHIHHKITVATRELRDEQRATAQAYYLRQNAVADNRGRHNVKPQQ